ncbi:MAG TPA: SDR family oxidoreductase [Spirochaetia bacterium]|nr:SDR family oxidoreductase [Spirochaetia bacterium]
MSARLKDKIAVVTGGTRGIGHSIAEALLDEGASVYICGHDDGFLKSALERLRKKAGDAVDGSLADMRRYDECRGMIRKAADRFGGIDILVNSAGIGIFRPVDQLTPAEWDDTIATNLSGVFYCCHEAIPLMRERGGGYIFNISSLAGINAFAGGGAYNASKFGLNGFSEALMQDIRYDGIRVSYIMPGSVDTDFAAAPGSKPREGWKLSAQDIAKAVVDLSLYPSGSLASRIELRPAKPPRK